MKDQYPIEQIVQLLDDDGHDVMVLADLKNDDISIKVDALKPLANEAFDKFTKEVSLIADSTQTNVKIKAILIIT